VDHRHDGHINLNDDTVADNSHADGPVASSQFVAVSIDAALPQLRRGPHAGIVVKEVFEGDGDILFAPANLASRASCQSGSARFTNPGVRRIGSRSRTRKRQR
jgi:hypothetical protein